MLGVDDLSWQAWPKSGVANGMIKKGEDPKAVDDLRGSIARGAFYQGEPIRREKLIKGANGGFMSAILPSGMRAVAINIDSQGSTSAGGFILPGDRVDLVRTYHDDASKNAAGGGGNAFISETLLRNVRVLAIGQNVQDKQRSADRRRRSTNATLELDPVQAETIILAQRVGQLSLTLRSLQDAEPGHPDVRPAKDDKDVTVVRFGFASDGLTR